MIEYLSREDQGKLRGLLQEVRGQLVEDLAAAIAKPYEAISYQPRVATGDRPQPLPYDPSAEDAAKYLHNELHRWVTWLAQERNLETQTGQWTTPGLARWLENNIITLATTPGSEPAYADIASEVKAAKRATRRPQQPTIHVDEISHVRNQQLNATGIAAIAREVQVDGLTKRRVHMLAENGHITPTRMYGRIPIYRLGDVLDAHNTTQQRQRPTG